MSKNQPAPSGPWILAIVAGFLAVMLGLLFSLEGTSDDGVRMAIRATARTSFTLFLLAYVASSLHFLWKNDATSWLLGNRRWVGLSFALSHFTHLGLIIVRGFATEWPPLSSIASGGSIYVVIAALAATSSNRAVRFLGWRNWRRLHWWGMQIIWAVFMLAYGSRASTSWGYATSAILLVLAVLLRISARWMGRHSRATEFQGFALR